MRNSNKFRLLFKLDFYSHSTFQWNFFVGDIYSINWISSQESRCCLCNVQVPTSKILYSDFNLVNWQFMEKKRRETTSERDFSSGKYCTEPSSFVNIAILEKNKLPQSDEKLWARKSVSSKYFMAKFKRLSHRSKYGTILSHAMQQTKEKFIPRMEFKLNTILNVLRRDRLHFDLHVLAL